MPDIRTAQELNQWLAACGCCQVALTPEPRVLCQSLQGEAAIVGYAPFTLPAGAPEDDLPAIYATLSPFTETYDNGEGRRLWRLNFGDGTSTEYYRRDTYTENVWVIATSVQYYHDASVPSCGVVGDANSLGTPGPADVTFTISGGPTGSCTATEHKVSQLYVSQSGTAMTPQGCPGPFTATDEEYWEFTRREDEGDRLSAPKTKADLRADAVADIPETWPDPATGTLCTAAFEADWPTIGDIGEWPSCPDGPPAAEASALVRQTRYRIGVPSGYPGATYDAQWDEGFFPAAWIAWDDGGRIGAEPEPLPTRVAARSWSYAATEISDWFNLPAPTAEGETRVVNLLVAGSQTKYGRKPTSYGDTYDFDA